MLVYLRSKHLVLPIPFQRRFFKVSINDFDPFQLEIPRTKLIIIV